MGLFGKKDEKVVYDDTAEMTDRYEITLEEKEKIEEIVEQLKKQVDEKYPKQIKGVSYEEGKKIISNLYAELRNVAERRFKFSFKVNEFKHVYRFSNKWLRVDKEVIEKPKKGTERYGMLAAFLDSRPIITRATEDALREKYKEEKIDYSKIDI